MISIILSLYTCSLISLEGVILPCQVLAGYVGFKFDSQGVICLCRACQFYVFPGCPHQFCFEAIFFDQDWVNDSKYDYHQKKFGTIRGVYGEIYASILEVEAVWGEVLSETINKILSLSNKLERIFADYLLYNDPALI
jgi:hypothetical protein